MKLKKGMEIESIGNNRGFTLIEMAIVLIIIGIIIGAVVKGKDLVRGAVQKKIYSKFINEWRTAYLNFYDRTGKILGDSYDGTAGDGQDGKADTAHGTAGDPDDTGRNELSTGDSDGSVDYYGLNQIGLTAPVTNTASAWQYRYTDSDGNSHDLDIAFDYSGNYNYMMINNIPTELAIALDTMIDGEVDGTKGDFITSGGTAWGTTPTAENDDVRWKMEF